MDLLERYLKHRRVSTDTRTVQPGDLFFALKGDRFDGNQYAHQAIDSGASCAIVDDPSVVKDDRYILVDDVLTALQNLAREYRRTHTATFIGLTGSNGKTTTKELMREVLNKRYKTQATRGNLNNHIGVPLTLLEVNPDAEMVIVEMGANHQKEIELLCSIAEPDFGLITNIGEAHLEGFGGIEGVRKGKGELFDFLRSHNRQAFVNTDLSPLPDMAAGMRTYDYSNQHLSVNLQEGQDLLSFSWKAPGQSELQQVQTHLTGTYNLYNALAAIAVGLQFDIPPRQISNALNEYVPSNNRSQLHNTATNTLILDAYNANPSSMLLALDNIARLQGDRFFIIGGMRELGDASNASHQKIADHAKTLGLEGWLVGQEYDATQTEFKRFQDADAVRAELESSPLTQKTILIKGSRGIRLETVVDRL